MLRRLLLPCALVFAACGDGPAPTVPDADPGADLDALFAPATAGEIAAIRVEWAARDVAPVDTRVEGTEPSTLGGAPATLRVLSHAIEGGRHYGAVVTPDGAAPGSLPVLVFAHGGDQGVSTLALAQLTLALGSVAADFVWVVPAFRSERLTTSEGSWRSDGEASPWDRDVDDALALLGAAIDETPEADADRIGVLGLSRGGGVALLMGVRDPRIDRVVEFSGPTDFFGPYIRDIVEDAVDGRITDLPGWATLDARYLQPFLDGASTIADLRLELVRRSVVLFATDLPPVQVHHGTADDVVDVGQAHALIEALEGLGRGAPADGFFLYAGGGHDPITLLGSVPRAVAFLGELRQE